MPVEPTPALGGVKWKKNGDHPEDGDPATEGEVVRYWRHPDVGGMTICDHCGQHLWRHGWIDQGVNGITVCIGDFVVIQNGEYMSIAPEIFKKLEEAEAFRQQSKPPERPAHRPA